MTLSAGPSSGQCPIYEEMQLDLYDQVRAWDYRRIGFNITLTAQDENDATVVVRKLS